MFYCLVLVSKNLDATLHSQASIEETMPLPITTINVPDLSESTTELVTLGVSDILLVTKSIVKVWCKL